MIALEVIGNTLFVAASIFILIGIAIGVNKFNEEEGKK